MSVLCIAHKITSPFERCLAPCLGRVKFCPDHYHYLQRYKRYKCVHNYYTHLCSFGMGWDAGDRESLLSARWVLVHRTHVLEDLIRQRLSFRDQCVHPSCWDEGHRLLHEILDKDLETNKEALVEIDLALEPPVPVPEPWVPPPVEIKPLVPVETLNEKGAAKELKRLRGTDRETNRERIEALEAHLAELRKVKARETAERDKTLRKPITDLLVKDNVLQERWERSKDREINATTEGIVKWIVRERAKLLTEVGKLVKALPSRCGVNLDDIEGRLKGLREMRRVSVCIGIQVQREQQHGPQCGCCKIHDP